MMYDPNQINAITSAARIIFFTILLFLENLESVLPRVWALDHPELDVALHAADAISQPLSERLVLFALTLKPIKELLGLFLSLKSR